VNRKTTWLLLLCLGWSGLLAAQEPDRAAETARRFGEALTAGEWAIAIEAGEELSALRPDNSTVRYNLACAYALAGRKTEAMASLERSADLGFSALDTVDTDPDLDSLRGEAEFAAVRTAVESNRTEALAAFDRRAAAARVLTFLPHGRSPKKPAELIVALHGFGGDADGFAPVYRQVAAERGAILIVPEAITPAGPGYSWGDVDEAERLVLRAIETVRAENSVDPEKIVLTGFSQGGFLTYILALRHPELFAGAIPVAGGFDPRRVPEGAAAGELPRFFILCGGEDRSLQSNRDALKYLRARGAKVRLRVYPGVGHSYPADREHELRQALGFAFGG